MDASYGESLSILSKIIIEITENILVFCQYCHYYLNMSYLYDLPSWPNFKVDETAIRQKENEVISLKGHLDGILSIIRPTEEDKALILSKATKDSWQIERINLDEDEIYSSISKRLGLPFYKRETKEYYDEITDVILDAVTNHEDMTLDRLLKWHSKIVSNEAGIKKGELRKGPVYVVSGSLKNQKVLYEGLEASLVPAFIQEFISFLNTSKYSDFITAAIAHHYFISIHPFEDGNGRTARIICDYIINKSCTDLPAVFISTEIKRKQKEYYEEINAANNGDMNITRWTMWFLDRIIDAYCNAIDMIKRSYEIKELFNKAKGSNLNERQIKVLGIILKEDWKGFITAKKYASITQCHVDTANRDLKKLVSLGFIKKNDGGSKNTSYSILN